MRPRDTSCYLQFSFECSLVLFFIYKLYVKSGSWCASSLPSISSNSPYAVIRAGASVSCRSMCHGTRMRLS